MASRPTLIVAGSSRDASLRHGRDVTPDEVYELRERHGFVTPLEPIAEGDSYCVFATESMWEWLFHPADAARYLATGIKVDGRDCVVQQVDEHPFMGAVQLRAFFPDRNGSHVAS